MVLHGHLTKAIVTGSCLQLAFWSLEHSNVRVHKNNQKLLRKKQWVAISWTVKKETSRAILDPTNNYLCLPNECKKHSNRWFEIKHGSFFLWLLIILKLQCILLH